MSDQDGLISEKTSLLPVGPAAEPLTAVNKVQDGKNTEEEREITDEEEEEEEEEDEMATSAHLEPSTLPWPGDKDRRPQTDSNDGAWPEKRVLEPEDEEMNVHHQTEEPNHEESARETKSRWRESMPEGERWRDDEIEVQHKDKDDGSLADDEDEGEEEEEEKEEEGGGGEAKWIPEKAALGFTPEVTIVRPSFKVQPEERKLFIERDEKEEMQVELDPAAQIHPQWTQPDNKYYLCEDLCSDKLKVSLATAAAGILFPLLVWGGYALLPFDSPLLQSAPLRVVYTLRCSFFATIPILLGMVVLGAARIRHGGMQPLYETEHVNRDVVVHWHFINESLALFLFFFLQLAVMATYINHDLVKLVPLLTIVFSFGRLIYWLCLFLDSNSFRAFGFSLSFLPILVMLGVNLYYVCSSMGQDAVFDVAPPTTPPSAPRRWWD